MPSKGYTIGGWAPTGARRIRQGLFGCVLEELHEHREGAREWRKSREPFSLTKETERGSNPPPKDFQ